MNSLNFGFGGVEVYLWQLLFLMTRTGAAFIAAPLFGATSMPPQVRIVLAAGIAIYILNWVPLSIPNELLSIATFTTLISEAVIGAALGFILQISFAAPILAGEQIGGAMGMGMVTAVDPSSGSHSGAIGQYFSVLLALVFLAVGGHLVWLRLVIESYSVFPPGGTWIGGERAALIAGFAAQAFVAAIAIALPILMVLLLVQVATGVLSRSAPALNLFALGLPMGVFAGIAAMLLASPMTGEAMGRLSIDALDNVGEFMGK